MNKKHESNIIYIRIFCVELKRNSAFIFRFFEKPLLRTLLPLKNEREVFKNFKHN